MFRVAKEYLVVKHRPRLPKGPMNAKGTYRFKVGKGYFAVQGSKGYIEVQGRQMVPQWLKVRGSQRGPKCPR